MGEVRDDGGASVHRARLAAALELVTAAESRAPLVDWLGVGAAARARAWLEASRSEHGSAGPSWVKRAFGREHGAWPAVVERLLAEGFSPAEVGELAPALALVEDERARLEDESNRVLSELGELTSELAGQVGAARAVALRSIAWELESGRVEVEELRRLVCVVRTLSSRASVTAAAGQAG